jgi:hypothetical protein
MNFFVITSPPKAGMAISPVVIARLPVGKPWQSQERLLRRFAPRNDKGKCHCEASLLEAVAISSFAPFVIASPPKAGVAISFLLE